MEYPTNIRIESDREKIEEAYKKKKHIKKETATSAENVTFSLTYDQGYKLYESLWRNMDRENNLINQRISWCLWLTAGFLTAQSFMLGAVLTRMSQQNLTPDQPTILAALVLLCGGLSFGACAFCGMTFIGVQAAHNQINYLKRRYCRLFVGDERLFQDYMRLPRPFGHNVAHISGNVAAKVFPLTMASMWAVFCGLELRVAFMIGDPFKVLAVLTAG